MSFSNKELAGMKFKFMKFNEITKLIDDSIFDFNLFPLSAFKCLG